MRIGSPVESLRGLECSFPPYQHQCLGRTLCRQSNNDPLYFRWSRESVFSIGIFMSHHHEPCSLDQFASSCELGEKYALLSFVRKGHVLDPGELTHCGAPFAGNSHGQCTVRMKNKFV